MMKKKEFLEKGDKSSKIDFIEYWLIDWSLMPTLAIFQLYCGIREY